MNIKEKHINFGSVFQLDGSVEEVSCVLHWLKENKIQYISEYNSGMGRSNYWCYILMIKDESYVMAFKLRWL